MNTELEPDVIKAIQAGRKIDAIKQLRAHRKIGLKEAKEMVDAYYLEHDISVEKVSSSNSIIAFVVMIAIAYVLYANFS